MPPRRRPSRRRRERWCASPAAEGAHGYVADPRAAVSPATATACVVSGGAGADDDAASGRARQHG
eukprot:4793468-Prymnesium_polylepis.1